MFLNLNNLLQLQYDGFINKLATDWVSESIYAIEGDFLMAVGKPYCVIISLIDGSMSKREGFNYQLMTEPVIIEEGTLRNEVLRYVLMRLRRVLNIAPVADDHMLDVLRGKINDSLKFFDIAVFKEPDNIVVDLKLQGGHGTVEEVLTAVADETIIGEILGDVDMDYLKRLVGLGRFEEALEIFLSLYDRAQPGTMFDNEINMYLGELYYHLDELDNSVERYKMCNPIYINDIRDYYIRLGHSLLDDKAGLRGNLIKMYYRSTLNPAYKKSIADRYDKLVEQIEPIYAAHESECEAAGAAAVQGNTIV